MKNLQEQFDKDRTHEWSKDEVFQAIVKEVNEPNNGKGNLRQYWLYGLFMISFLAFVFLGLSQYNLDGLLVAGNQSLEQGGQKKETGEIKKTDKNIVEMKGSSLIIESDERDEVSPERAGNGKRLKKSSNRENQALIKLETDKEVEKGTNNDENGRQEVKKSDEIFSIQEGSVLKTMESKSRSKDQIELALETPILDINNQNVGNKEVQVKSSEIKEILSEDGLAEDLLVDNIPSLRLKPFNQFVPEIDELTIDRETKTRSTSPHRNGLFELDLGALYHGIKPLESAELYETNLDIEDRRFLEQAKRSFFMQVAYKKKIFPSINAAGFLKWSQYQTETKWVEQTSVFTEFGYIFQEDNRVLRNVYQRVDVGLRIEYQKSLGRYMFNSGIGLGMEVMHRNKGHYIDGLNRKRSFNEEDYFQAVYVQLRAGMYRWLGRKVAVGLMAEYVPSRDAVNYSISDINKNQNIYLGLSAVYNL